MINKVLIILLLFSFAFFYPSMTHASSSIQYQIDHATVGDVIEIPAGSYDETIVLAKPVTLEGKGDVIIRSCKKHPVITIKGQKVTLKNIKVEQCSNDGQSAAIYVTGSHHLLEHLEIITTHFGMKLDGANQITIQNTEILGGEKGNGIDLWESKRNTIKNNRISKAADGIYIERSHQNTLIKNTIDQSRYGIHVMFSDGTLINKNQSLHNVSGAMIMEAKNTIVSNNNFSFNSRNVHSQGLLLYQAPKTDVKNNQLISNRVGIFIESTEKSKLQSNEIKGNFIGIQFKNSKRNQLSLNSFIGNVNEAQAIGSSNNTIEHNAWDTALKLDTEGKGTSAIPFTADPFFLTLTTDVPEFQLFFQNPGMTLLQKLLKSPEEALLIDRNPLMEIETVKDEPLQNKQTLWLISTSMILASMILFIFGRKRL